MGSLKKINEHNEVQDDFMLSAIDIVADPSAPHAFVNGILEGKFSKCLRLLEKRLRKEKRWPPKLDQGASFFNDAPLSLDNSLPAFTAALYSLEFLGVDFIPNFFLRLI